MDRFPSKVFSNQEHSVSFEISLKMTGYGARICRTGLNVDQTITF